MDYAIVFLPLLGSFISGFFGKRFGDKFAEIITSLFVSIAAILSILSVVSSGISVEIDTNLVNVSSSRRKKKSIDRPN